MENAPAGNIERLGRALLPFEDADLVILFGTEGSAEALRNALAEISAPDLVTLMIGADHGLTGTFHGVDGFVEGWRDFIETFASLHSRITELVEVGPDVVYGETHQTGVTTTGGIEVEYRPAAVFRFADDLLQQAEFHLDRDAARMAAGLDPDRPAGD
jgi:ketosteroid isomerase-like protein